MEATRAALVVAAHDFVDPKFQRLRSPAQDVDALAGVLGNGSIGGFEVDTILNESSFVVQQQLERFFSDRKPDDLLLLYFSCHGVKDPSGRLYFVTSNTTFDLLRSTGISASFVSEQMEYSRSKRIVVLLDCCYSGAFLKGFRARGDDSVAVDQLEGRGRAVMTASRATEYAFEADQLATENARPSMFTGAIVEGLASGKADKNGDGLVTIDELYDYVYDAVRGKVTGQTPGRWTDVEGDLIIARNPLPQVRPAPLPLELQRALESDAALQRLGAVSELAQWLGADDPARRLAAEPVLQELCRDYDQRVKTAATAALAAGLAPPPPAVPAAPATGTAARRVEPAEVAVPQAAPAASVAPARAASPRVAPAAHDAPAEVASPPVSPAPHDAPAGAAVRRVAPAAHDAPAEVATPQAVPAARADAPVPLAVTPAPPEGAATRPVPPPAPAQAGVPAPARAVKPAPPWEYPAPAVAGQARSEARSTRIPAPEFPPPPPPAAGPGARGGEVAMRVAGWLAAVGGLAVLLAPYTDYLRYDGYSSSLTERKWFNLGALAIFGLAAYGANGLVRKGQERAPALMVLVGLFPVALTTALLTLGDLVHDKNAEEPRLGWVLLVGGLLLLAMAGVLAAVRARQLLSLAPVARKGPDQLRTSGLTVAALCLGVAVTVGWARAFDATGDGIFGIAAPVQSMALRLAVVGAVFGVGRRWLPVNGRTGATAFLGCGALVIALYVADMWAGDSWLFVLSVVPLAVGAAMLPLLATVVVPQRQGLVLLLAWVAASVAWVPYWLAYGGTNGAVLLGALAACGALAAVLARSPGSDGRALAGHRAPTVGASGTS